MQPRDLFGVVVRTTGLLCLLYGAGHLLIWLAFVTGYQSTLEHSVRLHGLVYSALGIAVIRAAGLMVRFAYPSSRQ
jgi:hypothetical protein